MPIPLMAAAAGASGLVKVLGGVFGGGKRRRERRRAKKAYNTQKQAYESLDTSNLYLGQENMFEDLTVNQQEAEFVAEQQQQGLANILDSQSQAAGGSGIAALSQALANRQSMNLAQSAISIGKQERQNQLMAKQAAAQIQQSEIQGEKESRALEYDKTETLLGMAGQRVAAANQAKQQATQSIMGGLGDIAGGALMAGADGAFGEGVENFLGGGN